MVCLPSQALQYLAKLVNFLIVINLVIYLIYLAKHQDHLMTRYKVLSYWILSVLCLTMKQSNKSFYFLTLTLAFSLQSLILGILDLGALEILWTVYALTLVIGRIILEVIIGKQQDQVFNDPETGSRSLDDGVKKGGVRVLNLIGYFITLAYFEYLSIVFWIQVFSDQEVDIQGAIILAILQIDLLFLLNVIIYNRRSYLQSILLVAICLIYFYFAKYWVDLIILSFYLFNILVLYIASFRELI